MSKKHIAVVAGTRPNFMKAAPLLRALNEQSDFCDVTFIHSGQHYDRKMSEVFFEDLGIGAPDIQFVLQSKTHSGKIAEVIQRMHAFFEEQKPDWVVVFGDVNTTIAAAVSAVKCGVKVAHVESGLRSFDRRMPEELNRILTDHISDVLYVSEDSGLKHLTEEKCPEDRVVMVGNIMIDSLVALLPRIRAKAEELALPNRFAITTLHRQENVDDPAVLSLLVSQLEELSQQMDIIWPIHPRTAAEIEKHGLQDHLSSFTILEPLGYVDFLAHVSKATVVVTDSGGIQEETTYLGVPCVTLRDTTERPSTMTEGTNILVPPYSLREEPLVSCVERALDTSNASIPSYWDGKAAQRIVEHLLSA